MISTQITRVVSFMVVRAGIDQEETESSDLDFEILDDHEKNFVSVLF